MIKKRKEYYSLREMGERVDIKTRQLKNRIKKVKEKYKDNKKLLWKGNKSWNIHWSLTHEFDRVKLTKVEKERKFVSVVSINPHGKYDVAYNLELLNKTYEEISSSSPIPIRMKYFIEQGEGGDDYHTHFLINLSPDYQKLIKRAANFYTRTNTDVRYIYEEHQLMDYLEKDVVEYGFIDEFD